MQQRLAKRMQAAGEKMPVILPAPVVESGQKRVLEAEAYQ